MEKPERFAACLVILMALGAVGCAAKEPLQVLLVQPLEYEAAFDAAVEAAREQGMPPLARDRRAGQIETSSSIAASILEPWRGDNAGLGQTIEHTVAFQRRRAKFEFYEPADTGGARDAASVRGVGVDLTQAGGPLELHCSVIVERANSPGVRRGTWSRGLTTRDELMGEPDRRLKRDRGDEAGAREGEAIDGPIGAVPWGRGRGQTVSWTPLYRDAAYEQMLLEAVRDKLEERRQSESDQAR